MLPKFKVLAIVVMVGFGSLCSLPVKSEGGSDQPKSPSEQGVGELGLNVFGLSLHANRSSGYNEINPGVGLRYAFWHPAPSWTVFADTSIYYDSRRQWAKYVALGESYRFAESWTVGVGVTYGQSQTYHHGKPFFGLVPGVGFGYHRVTFNTVLLPSESASSKIQGLAFFVTIPLEHRDSAGPALPFERQQRSLDEDERTPTNPISPLALSREPVIRCLGAPSWRWISYP